MGIFHLRCQASGLGIVTENVALILVARDGKVFAPIAPPIRGQYDSYGSIEKIAFGPTTERILAGFVDLYEKQELLIPDFDPSNPFGDDLSPESLRGLLEYMRQGLIFEAVRSEGTAESTLVRARGLSLGFVMVLAPIYDAAVAMVKESVAGEALAGSLAQQAFGALVEASLGAPALSRALVEDSSGTREALIDFALLRSWFDSHGSWSADYVGAQYSRRELRGLIRTAKANLARWPQLVAAVDEYESCSLRLAEA